MVGFKITNLLTNIITCLYAFLFCGLELVLTLLAHLTRSRNLDAANG